MMKWYLSSIYFLSKQGLVSMNRSHFEKGFNAARNFTFKSLKGRNMAKSIPQLKRKS